MIHSIITREQALEIEKRHIDYYKKLEEKIKEDNIKRLKITNIESIRKFIKNKYKSKSITDFICKLTEFEMTKDLLKFKIHLQSKIKDGDPKKVYLVYFALKDFIRSKRLEILYKMRDNGVIKCKEKYPHWRIWDTILNTKWKYMNKSFSYENPIIDKVAEIEYKNIKEASSKSGISEDYIKNNFGRDKRYAYISDFRQFQNCFPIYVSCAPNRSIQFSHFKFPTNEFIFDDMYDLSYCTGESIEKLKKYIDKDYDLYKKYTLRTVPFEEQFRLYSPVVIEGNEFCDATEASDFYWISDRAITKNVNKVYTDPYGCSFDIRSKEDERFVTKEEKYSFDLDKKLANKMLTKLKEIRKNNNMRQIFYP